jgi:hypothetical protein
MYSSMEPIPNSSPATATPILDLLQPLPGEPRARRLRGLFLSLLSGILCGGFLIGRLEFQLPAVIWPLASIGKMLIPPVEFWDRLFLLGELVAIWAAFSAAVVVHELGRFVVGRLVGFGLQSLRLGPVSVAFDSG